MLQLFIENNINNIKEALLVHSIIQKLEPIGDQTKIIAEKTAFYFEATVLRHAESQK